MIRLINALSTLLGAIVSVVVLVILAAGGWAAYSTYFGEKLAREKVQEQLVKREAELARMSRDLHERDAQIALLNRDLEAQRREIERLEMAMRLLKVDRRVARLTVLGQTGSQKQGDLRTEFSFVELDDAGQPIERPRTFNIQGDLVYLDAWVVKFTDQYVEQGDPLRATSVCLFRRLFGENQRPADGFSLDPVGSQPIAYRAGREPTEFEQQLWQQFWHYANDPAKAEAAGVRAAHGEAPSIKLVPGKQYRVQLRASDGLSIVPEPAESMPRQAPDAAA